MGDKLSLHVIRANCGDLLEIQKQLQLQIDVSSFADYYRGVRVEEREKSEGHIELVFSSEDEQEMMRFLRGLATQVSVTTLFVDNVPDGYVDELITLGYGPEHIWTTWKAST